MEVMGLVLFRNGSCHWGQGLETWMLLLQWSGSERKEVTPGTHLLQVSQKGLKQLDNTLSPKCCRWSCIYIQTLSTSEVQGQPWEARPFLWLALVIEEFLLPWGILAGGTSSLFQLAFALCKLMLASVALGTSCFDCVFIVLCLLLFIATIY